MRSFHWAYELIDQELREHANLWGLFRLG